MRQTHCPHRHVSDTLQEGFVPRVREVRATSVLDDAQAAPKSHQPGRGAGCCQKEPAFLRLAPVWMP